MGSVEKLPKQPKKAFLSDEEFEDLKAQHGRLRMITTELGTIVLRKPNRQEFGQYIDQVTNEKGRLQVVDSWVRRLAIHPDRETLALWLDELPGIPLACGGAINDLAGIVQTAEVKK